MPAFYLLAGVGVVALYFLISFLYRPIGRLIWAIWKDAIDNMNDVEEKEKDE